MTPFDEEIDRLLKQRELNPPEDFHASLMSQVHTETARIENSTQSSSFLQWIALGVGGIFGMVQSIYFLFGIWFATAVG